MALYGGAAYIKTSNKRVICAVGDAFSNQTFDGNLAITVGDDILVDFQGNYDSSEDDYNCGSLDNILVTYYSKINLTSTDHKNSLTLFPGQYINFLANSTITCESTVYLTCTTCPEIKRIHHVHGPATIVIPYGSNNIIYTHMKFTGAVLFESKYDFSLSLLCQSFTSSIPIKFRKCPLSFTFNSSSMVCVPCKNCDSHLYRFSLREGVACLKYGYWYSNTDNSLYHCYSPYCKSAQSLESCPVYK